MEKAETQAVGPRILAGRPEALAVEQWPWMVRPWTRVVKPGFWTGKNWDIMSELRAARSSGGCNGDASGGMRKPLVEAGV